MAKLAKTKSKDLRDIPIEEQIRAVELMREVGASKAAKILGVPRSTLRYWGEKTEAVVEKSTKIQAMQVEIQRNVRQEIIDARRDFLSSHFVQLNNLFRLSLDNIEKSLKNGTITTGQAILIADKIANIINTMSNAPAVPATQVNNLLQFCINEANKKG